MPTLDNHPAYLNGHEQSYQLATGVAIAEGDIVRLTFADTATPRQVGPASSSGHIRIGAAAHAKDAADPDRALTVRLFGGTHNLLLRQAGAIAFGAPVYATPAGATISTMTGLGTGTYQRIGYKLTPSSGAANDIVEISQDRATVTI